ncbi:hypothetical protein LSH36_541g02032 [Paralvinella palmiformis]|uniref:Uncharacterized protein n=1 Tax=Paralvinella palmiformis TaxID=53620 RepID=A0AAD9J6S6_9ANNE|nr:hypothetical protein LSH36_541g02032 [Paralvinella palmiformis]
MRPKIVVHVVSNSSVTPLYFSLHVNACKHLSIIHICMLHLFDNWIFHIIKLTTLFRHN